MQKIRVALLVIFIFVSGSSSFSQSVSFTQVPPPKEFSFTLITGITQDPRGFMWFSSGNILYRYNGYEFTTYKNDPRNPASLAGSRLETVYADKKGFIWTGDFGSGLNKLDPRTGVFTHYRHDVKNPSTIGSDTVISILEDRHGTFWIGTQHGLNQMDPNTGKFTRYYHNPNDPSSLSHDYVGIVYEDRAGTIWVGTGSSFDKKENGTFGREGGLNRFDGKTGKFTRYLNRPGDDQSLVDNRVRAIFEDSRGVFWVGTAGDGLHTMDRSKGTFQRHSYNPAQPGKLSRPPLQHHIDFAEDHISFIKEDATGSIWIGTFQGGLNRYNPKTGSAEHFSSSKNADSLHENGPWIMYTSREGVIWISTWERDKYNLYKMDPLKKSIPHVDLAAPVNSFQEDDSGRLWVGSRQGLLLTKGNKVLKRFVHDPSNPASISSNGITSLKMDQQGILWVGLEEGGLNSFDPKTSRFNHYENDMATKGSFARANIFSIVDDGKDALYLATTMGLECMNRKDGTITHYENNPRDSNSLSNSIVTAVVQDEPGVFWLGTWNEGGINHFNKHTGKWKRYLKGMNVSSIYKDGDGTVWVGTLFGLYYKPKDSDVFLLYSDPGSSIETANIITIVGDDQENLWVSSFSGIFRINRRQKETSVYGLSQGVNPSTLHYLAGYKLRNGKLLFGTDAGYYTFSPGDLIASSKPPQIVITDFKMGDQNANLHGLLDSLRDASEMRLDYDQNSFSFNFAGIHYSDPEGNRHLFMLENYDKSWRVAGAERTASYFQIPPGNYVFHVKAASKDGIWASKKIVIIITPPWWGTWKFRIIAGLLLFALFYGLIRWRTRQKFKLQLERSQKEKELADLRHKTSELEMHALRSQMSPHFIFNSLNAINRFILMNNKAQASEYLTKFSRLVRLILQNSQAAFITLESELEALQLYLELEALRFEQHFEFKINVDKELDLSMLKVPPLIIQPYAENAIWHGLMHKEEKGHLFIELFQKEDSLFCRVTDDGIGRKRAAELKSKSANTHKSMGMRITADRIALLQSKNQVHTSIQITDLVLADGSAGGTEVVLKLPVKYD